MTKFHKMLMTVFYCNIIISVFCLVYRLFKVQTTGNSLYFSRLIPVDWYVAIIYIQLIWASLPTGIFADSEMATDGNDRRVYVGNLPPDIRTKVSKEK